MFQNWRKVEYYTRLISIELKVRVRIFTGNFGVLKKKTKKGPMSDVYLDYTNGRIAVPLLVWKLVINVGTHASIAFLTSNDPAMSKKEVNEFSALCDSKCDKLGYSFKKALPAGCTLCCSYEEFAKHVKFLPIQLKKKSALLANPKPKTV